MTGRSPAARRERRVVAWSVATLFAVGWATVSITNVSEALFLKRVGVTRLPAVFLANSVLLFLTTAAVGRLGARVDAARLVPRVLAGLALALGPLWALVVANQTSAFVLLVIAAKQLSSIALVVLWVALGSLIDSRQAKRLYAPISAGGTLGMIAGSFATGPLGRALGTPALVGVTAAALLVAALASLPLARLAPARLGVAAPSVIVPARPARSAMALLWREGPLFRALVASAVLSGLLGPMLYFQFSYVADLATQGSNGEQRLLALYGVFRGWMNVAVLACQLAGTSWLFQRIGVPLAASIAPGVYLLGFAGLGVRFALPAGLAAVAAASIQDHAVFDPAQRTLATLVPARHRAAAIAAIEGPARRLGGVLGNGLVIAALAVGTPAGVGRAGLAFAVVWLALALRLWRSYPTLLLGALARPARDGELPFEELLDAGTLRALEASLVDPDPARVRAACGIVADAPAARTTALLARAARRAPAATRPLLVETLHRAAAVAPPSPAAADDVAALLDAPAGLDGGTRARLLQAYARLAGRAGPGSAAHDRIRRHRDDPEPAVRLAAAVLTDDDGTTAGSALAAALAGDDPTARAIAVVGLRATLLAPPDERFGARLALLAGALDVPAARAAAAAALADVAEAHGAAAVGPALLAHRDDPDARVRVAALRAVGALNLAAEAPWVVERLAAGAPEERDAAHAALKALGPAAAPALVSALRSGRRGVRDAVLEALGDLRVERATLDALLDAEIDTLRRLAVQRWALDGRVADLVLARLEERGREAAQSVILLLAARAQDPRLAALARLAGRVEDPRDRAVLLEALEALLPPDEQARLLPLLEDRDAGARAAAAVRALRVPLPSPDEALAAALADDDVLTRSFLVETLAPEVVARHDGHLPLPPGTEPGRAFRLASGGAIGEEAAEAASRMLSRVEIVLHLRSLALFERLTTRELSDLATIVREERRQAGEKVVREGDFDDFMFLLVSGEVDVVRGGVHLATTGPGEFFGEMAVLDGETRSADVIARTPVHLLRLERSDLFRLMDEQPSIAIGICRTLSRRVRNLLAQHDAPKA